MGLERTDPAPLPSRVYAWRSIVSALRRGGGGGNIHRRPPLKLRVSSASKESTSNKTIDSDLLQYSTRGGLCLASFICGSNGAGSSKPGPAPQIISMTSDSANTGDPLHRFVCRSCMQLCLVCTIWENKVRRSLPAEQRTPLKQPARPNYLPVR